MKTLEALQNELHELLEKDDDVLHSLNNPPPEFSPGITPRSTRDNEDSVKNPSFIYDQVPEVSEDHRDSNQETEVLPHEVDSGAIESSENEDYHGEVVEASMMEQAAHHIAEILNPHADPEIFKKESENTG